MKYKKSAVVRVSVGMGAAALSVVASMPLRGVPIEAASSPPPPSSATVQSAYGHLPLSFEVNEGQWDPTAKFLTRGRRHEVYLTPREAVLVLRTDEAAGDGRAEVGTKSHSSSSASAPSRSVVRMTFDGGNPHAEVVGLEKLPGIVNYFIGGDPSKWHTNIPTYKKVAVRNLYDGIDLLYYGHQDQLEYDLIVAPGADPQRIRLAFEGAEQVEVGEHGDLIVTLPRSLIDRVRTAAPALRLHKPVVYQRGDEGQKHFLTGAYVLLSSETQSPRPTSAKLHPSERSRKSSLTTQVAFQVASYDANKPLIIDPVLSWATYLGGSWSDFASAIALDQAGNVYVTGQTNTPGSGFPGTANSLIQSTLDGYPDAFVTKFNASGTALVYSTYLGSIGTDVRNGIAVDQTGNAYVTGSTNTIGFPGTAGSSIQNTFAGGFTDAFVAKLNAAGTVLVYSTYLGGSGIDGGDGIAVDQAGNAYVTGGTSTPGSGFPGMASSLIQNTFAGDVQSELIKDAFVAKLNAAGTALVYATYLGGSGDDHGHGIAVDQAGNVYVTGETGTPGSGFPGTAASSMQNTFAGGFADAFVAKVNAAGTALVYATYLGGSGDDRGNGITVDQAGNGYVTGETGTPESGFPGTAGSSIQSTFGGGARDAFIAQFNPAGTALGYTTYLGGSGDDAGQGIAVDQAGNAYVIGRTNTPGSGFPGTAESSIQSTFGGGVTDAFVTKLNAAGTVLVYATYLGGDQFDEGNGIVVDQSGSAYVTGYTATYGSRFPGTADSPIQSTPGGGFDAFVAKVITNTGPICSAAKAVPHILWNPNHRLVPVAVHGVTDPDGNPVSITVIGVTQDEPVHTERHGHTRPDAVIQAGSASVRAERLGSGNGRVYEITFKTDDGQGGFCTGAVKVSVPHSLRRGATAIDDGQIYDSTVP